MKIGFVTDSTADLPLDLAAQNGIEVVPALVNIHGHSYSDGIELSREEFYRMLPGLNPPPTTSAPSVGAFQERYEKLFSAGMQAVVSVHPPNSLSGTFNAARLAAEEFNGRVKVVDSGSLSLGIGFQVLAGVESAGRSAALEEVLAAVHSAGQRARVAALLESLEYVRRSGRISWAKAMIGNLLHLQPLIEIRDGIVHRLGQARTRSQGLRRLTEVLNSLGPLDRLAVLHTNAESAARQLMEELRGRVPSPPLVVNVTTAIGSHVGPNGLGFAAVPIRP